MTTIKKIQIIQVVLKIEKWKNTQAEPVLTAVTKYDHFNANKTCFDTYSYNLNVNTLKKK